MSDIIQDLITEVEKYPCIWDIENINYQNKIQRDLAWEEICITLCLGKWRDLNPEQKKKICEEKKKRWNNLRDGFRKYLNRIKNIPSVSGALPPKKYIYMDELYFLAPIFQKNTLPEEGAPLESPEVNEHLEEDDKERNRRRILRNELKKCRNKRKSKTEDVPQQILNIVQRSTDASVNYQDEDSQFLLSFRNDMKVLSRSQKLNFKLGMIQLMQCMTESGPSSSGNCSGD